MSTSTFRRTKIGNALAWIAIGVAAWLLAQSVLLGINYLLIPLALAAAAVILLQTLKDWRVGVLFFITWMLFEDLVRKYLGNNMAVYFAKDLLVAACCLSYYVSRGSKRILQPRPKFLFPMALFFFWSLLEVFNPNSPSVWYGFLGLKLYFGYVPLFLLGYSLLETESDLRRFLTVNMMIAALIALLGVVQGVTGKLYLSPIELAPDIRELGSLVRRAPITGEQFLRPPSVFVSDGRFGAYLLLALLLGLGATGYFFLRRLNGRKWLVLAVILMMGGIIMSGVRSALMWVIISVIVFIPVYARDLGLRGPRLRRIITAVFATVIPAILAIILFSVYYPEALGSRVAFYQQTLLPSSSSFELSHRLWDYPTSELQKVLDFPSWFLGYGTGTCSLGAQYITRILGAAPTGIGVESGYGNLILEMGIPGLLLWIAWTSTLLVEEWKIVRQLRGTDLFPLGFFIFWFSFITLCASMMNGLAIENFVTNAYLFLLSGLLFGLPALKNREPNIHTQSGQPEKPTDSIPQYSPSEFVPLRS